LTVYKLRPIADTQIRVKVEGRGTIHEDGPILLALIVLGTVARVGQEHGEPVLAGGAHHAVAEGWSAQARAGEKEK